MIFDSLEVLRNNLIETGYQVKLLSITPPAFEQYGQYCKLSALSAGLQWSNQISLGNGAPPPYPTKKHMKKAYFSAENMASRSLREQAKKMNFSAVGEIYDIRDLVTLSHLNGYSNTYFQSFDSQESYQEALTNAVDNNIAANVFYDVDRSNGEPINNQTQTEHAAIVVGYARDQSLSLKIIVSTWGGYAIMDADKLYVSCEQLVDREKPEHFRKKGNTFWQNDNEPETSKNSLEKRRVGILRSHPVQGFRRKILFIEPTLPSEEKKLSLSDIQVKPSSPQLNLSELLTSIQGKHNFIPIDIVVHFFEIALLSKTTLAENELRSFLVKEQWLDAIKTLCLKQYKTELSGSVTDDIFKQNADSKRSIVELTSNALDAQATQVRVTIKEGSYQIDDNGCGMTLEAIFYYLLTPKNSNKLQMAESIGRFGVGFFTALAHLIDDESEVQVITQSPSSDSAFNLCFKRIDEMIQLKISLLPQRTPGTTIIVQSNQINESEYLPYLTNHFSCLTAPILTINGQQVLLEEDYKIYPIDGAALRIKETKKGRYARLRMVVSKVLISEFITPSRAGGIDVIWYLPNNTTITEGRNFIQLDSEAIINTLINLINIVQILPQQIQVSYINAIAVTIDKLQSRNTFTGKHQNLKNHLTKVLQLLIGDNKYLIPDCEEYDFLNNERAIAIHDCLLSPTWQNAVGFQPLEWSSSKIMLYIVPMMPGEHFHFDERLNVLYFSELFYKKLQNDKDVLDNLENLLGNFLGGKGGHWRVAETSPSTTVSFHQIDYSRYNLPSYGELLIHHGGLAHYKRETLDNLNNNRKAKDILLASPTLVAKYPFRGPIKNFFGDFPEDTTNWAGIWFRHFTYKEKQYFIREKHDNKWDSLVYNHHFVPINGEQGILLRAIARACLSGGESAILDKLVVNKGKESQLISLDTGKILLDHLPVHSYYQPIEGNDCFLIRSVASDSRDGYENSHRGVSCLLFRADGTQLTRFSGDSRIIKILDKYLCLTFTNGDNGGTLRFTLFNEDFTEGLSSVTTKGYYFLPSRHSVKCYDYEDKKLIVIYASEDSCSVIYHPTEKRLELLTEAFYLFSSYRVNAMAINGYVWLFSNGYSKKVGGLIRKIEGKRSDKRDNSLLFYDNESSIKYLNAEGEITVLPVGTNIHNPSIPPTFKTSLGLIKQVGQRIINEQDLILYQASDNNKIHSIEAKKESPYFIVTEEDEHQRYIRSILIKADGGEADSLSGIRGANFLENTESWVIEGYINGHHIFINTDGLVEFKYNRSAKVPGMAEHPYIWHPHEDTLSYQYEGSRLKKITINTFYSPEVRDKYSCSDSSYSIVNTSTTIPPCFYRAIEEHLLLDEDVLENLHYLNQKDLSLDYYSNLLRFINCRSEIFKTLFGYLANFAFTPTREQFETYYTFYLYLLEENAGFIMSGMRLLDLVYYSSQYNQDNAPGEKLLEMVRLYGVGMINELYTHYSRNKNELYYVLNISESLDTYLAPLSQKVKEVSYYLFSKDVTMFAAMTYHSAFQENFACVTTSLLKLISQVKLKQNEITEFPTIEKFIAQLHEGCIPTHLHLPYRQLMHAIFHLGDVSSPIYLREFLQNALDATRDYDSPRVNVTLYRSEDGLITRIEDNGCGMSVSDILNYLIVPGNSSKRNQSQFIGGRGVGFFSAFNGAKKLLIKTSRGDGITHYLEFEPVINMMSNSVNHTIEDVKLRSFSKEENFQGTLIERVSWAANIELEAAKLKSSMRLYGRFIDANKINVSLNNVSINEKLEYLGAITIPEIGTCKIYSNAECVFTGSGLFIRAIDDDYWHTIPSFITLQLKKLGIVIEFPSTIKLTRERNDFESADKFKPFFKPYFFQLCLNAYCKLLSNGKISDVDLPYDLLDYLSNGKKTAWFTETIIQDAEKINQGELFYNEALYQSVESCLKLLAHIKFISYYQSKISIVDVAKLSENTQLNAEVLPPFIRSQIVKQKSALYYQFNFVKEISSVTNEYEKDLQKYKFCWWNPVALGFTNLPHWEYFYNLCQEITNTMAARHGLGNLSIMFSTCAPSALAYVKQGEPTIYINPFAWQGAIKDAFDFKRSNGVLVKKLIHTLSDEIAHLKEGSFCSGGGREITHDKLFHQMWSKVLVDFMNHANLKELKGFAENDFDKTSASRFANAKECMIMQIFQAFSYLEPAQQKKLKENSHGRSTLS